MGLAHSPRIVTNGLVFYYDMGNPQKSWKGAPTFNASLQDGQNDVNPWFGDGTPTVLGIDPIVRFRGRKVAKFQTGSSGNCYINGVADLSPSTTSTVWTSTFYLKRVDGTALSSVGMYLYVNGNTNVNTTVSVTSVEDGWYKAVYTRSGLVAGYPTLTGMFSLGASTQYYFADWQCENLAISTPWVNGTRSNTQAILDLTNNNTITASSLTYASDNTFSFNGSSNWIQFPTSSIFDSQTITMESWNKPTTTSQNGFLFEKGQVNTQYSNFYNSNGVFYFRTIGLSPQDLTFTAATHIVGGQWNHIVCTVGGGVKTVYINGIQRYQQTGVTGTMPTGQTNQYVGKYGNAGNNYPFNGQIAISRVYNRALTAQEVQQNFQATKGRYGL